MTPLSPLRRALAPGFRAPSAIAGLLLAVGLGQLFSLPARAERWPAAAAALAILLFAGGAALAALVALNAREPVARDAARPGPGVLPAAALAVLAAAALEVWRTTGTFFPLRMALAWRGSLPFERMAEPALPMMLAGTCLVALGAAATAALAGALWTLLYARRLDAWSRTAGAVLSFLGAIPYVAFALVVRALFCAPVAFLAAGHSLSPRPDDLLAYRSMIGIAPGLLAASVALGLGISRGLWSWLDEVRAAEESSDSFLAARLRGQPRWAILLRQGLWLRRRHELGALLLAGMAAAVLIDILSNTLIDAFQPPGFPLYPSLGAALFLRGVDAAGAPLPLPAPWAAAHVAIVAAALLLLVSQTLPRRARRIALQDGVLRIGPEVLARGVASAHGLAPRPALQWVLGPSGAGKSTLLRAWWSQLSRAVLVPQDPDEALPAAFSVADVGRLAGARDARADRVLWDLLGRFDDNPVRRRLFDPFTPVSTLSRGERQRLLLALALARTRADPDCTLLLDEPTSAQDAPRTQALLDCLGELTPPRSSGAGAVVLTSHDPHPLDALLVERSSRAAGDHVLWIEDGGARSFRLGREKEREGTSGFARYLSAIDALFDARDSAADRPPVSPPSDAPRLLPARLSIGGRAHSASPQARVRGGELIVLSGPSGCGKSTVLRSIAGRPPAAWRIGFVMQDAARAFPAEMPVREVLGPVHPRGAARWFGSVPGTDLLGRSIGSLSEGERQRIVLAAEVLRLDCGDRSRLLLLDEPFGAVDPPSHLRLMGMLLEWLREPGGRNAAILVSHSPLVDLGLARSCGVPAREWTIDGGER